MASKSAAVLIDLSGTIHVEDVAIPGAVEAVKTLMTSPNYHVKFVTNTTKESVSALQSRLKCMGFEITQNDLFTPLSAAKSIITHRALRPMLMLEKSALEDFKDVNMTDPNAVVVGLAPSHFNYERLNEAFNLVINGAQLIAIHEGRYHMARNGLQLGPGPFVAALKYAADVEAEVVGKPQKSFFMGALDTLNCHSKTSDAVMIGDDVRDDVIGAINAGMRGILVKTGKYRPGDELQIPAEARNCVDSVVQAISLIEKGQVN